MKTRSLKQEWSRRYITLTVLYLLLFGNVYHSLQAFAQGPADDWAPLAQVYSGELIDRPVLAPDATGALHALWWGRAPGEAENSPSAIFYARWDGKGWAQPTDVIVAPGGRDAQLPEAVVDRQGTLHVIWVAGQLYHSMVPAWATENPRNWSAPREIGDGRNVFSPSGLALAPNGVLHVVFAASRTSELFHTCSANDGQDWTRPNHIYTADQDKSTSFVSLATDSNGVLHVVWTENQLPDGYPTLGVSYARSEDGGLTWSEAVELIGADYGEGAVVAAPDGTIHVVYNGRAGVGGRYHRWSRDGGLTWSGPVEMMPPLSGGLTGHPGLSVDSTSALYFITYAALFMEWHGQGWSSPQDLQALGLIPLDYIEQTTLRVVGGNQLHVLFWDGRQRLWHTWRYIQAPAEAPIPYPVPSPEPAARETVTPKPDVTPPAATATLSPTLPISPPTSTGSPLQAMLMGIAPSVLLVAGALLVSLAHRRS